MKPTTETNNLQEYYDLLLPIAGNMLKDQSQAEDVVQETLLRWVAKEDKELDNPKGYLVRSTINRCLNVIRDQKKFHGQNAIDIAPELLVDHLPQLIENGPDLSNGILRILKRLNPMERAIFILKELFDYSHKEIADLLGITPENSRQILSRAKRHLKADKSRYSVDIAHHQELYQTFVEVCQGQDLGRLIEILKDDIKISSPEIQNMLTGHVDAGIYLLKIFRDVHSISWYHTAGGPYLLLGKTDKSQLWLKLYLAVGKLIQIDIEQEIGYKEKEMIVSYPMLKQS
ncbi:MAG: sigma-70 family RNA polymerase sigma factor [Bacteroidota bacterium]